MDRKLIFKIFHCSISIYALALLSSMAGMEIFGWLSVLLVFVLSLDKDRPFLHRWRSTTLPIDKLLLLFLGSAILGVVINVPQQFQITTLGKLRWIIVYFFIRMALSWIWGEQIQRFLRFLIVFEAGVAFYAIIQHFTGVDLLRGNSGRAVQLYGYRDNGLPFYRAAGLFSSPMTYGYSAAMFFAYPLAFVFSKTIQSRFWKWFYLLACVLIFLSLFATLQRGVWLAATVVPIVMAFYVGKRFFIKISLGALLFMACLITLSPDMKNRFFSIFDSNFLSNRERLELWQANLEMAKEHPILGVGYGRNEHLISQYYQKIGIEKGMAGHAHNNYFQMIAGTGWLGFTLYILIMGYFLVLSHRLWYVIPKEDSWNRSIILGTLGAQTALHIGGLTECNFIDAEVNHQFIFSLAIISSIYYIYQGNFAKQEQNNDIGYKCAT